MCTQTQVSLTDFEDIGNTCKYISNIYLLYIFIFTLRM